MDTWVEVEDGYITNQPLISGWSGKKGEKIRERIPDPDNPPTQAFMVCYHCRSLASGRIQRSRFMKTIEVSEASELDLKVAEFVLSPGHVLIETVDNPNKFISDGQKAVEAVVA